jgi:hypothetical protein
MWPDSLGDWGTPGPDAFATKLCSDWCFALTASGAFAGSLMLCGLLAAKGSRSGWQMQTPMRIEALYCRPRHDEACAK